MTVKTKTVSILLIGGLLICSNSCKKDDPVIKQEMGNLLNIASFLTGSNEYRNGEIHFRAWNQNQPNQSNPHLVFDGTALLVEDSAQFLNAADGIYAGEITIQGNSLTYQKYGPGDNNYRFDSADVRNVQYALMFGDTMQIEVEGHTVSHTVGSGILQLPLDDLVKITGPFNHDRILGSHDKGSDLNITWNTGNGDNYMIALLEYDGAVTQFYIPSADSSTILVHHVIEDDGSFTFNSSEFSNFPVGGICRLYLARINTKNLVLSDGKKIVVTGTSVATASFKMEE